MCECRDEIFEDEMPDLTDLGPDVAARLTAAAARGAAAERGELPKHVRERKPQPVPDMADVLSDLGVEQADAQTVDLKARRHIKNGRRAAKKSAREKCAGGDLTAIRAALSSARAVMDDIEGGCKR